MPKYLAAVDQGTTSTRCLFFNSETHAIEGAHQIKHLQITPHPGWLEHDPTKIFNKAVKCINAGFDSLKTQNHNVTPEDIAAFGISNQRETVVAWSRKTGKPLCNAIVWSDCRTQGIVNEFVEKHGNGNADFLKDICGLPCSTYFSAFKMKWMLDNVPEVKNAALSDELLFGTMDSWLIYKLTEGELHVTDCTNASRTMLMNLRTLEWDKELCVLFGISISWLPKIKSNCGDFGRINSEKVRHDLRGVRITGCIGDQQGSLFGQRCFLKGQAKNTYGTGCFLLANIGHNLSVSRGGLLSTVAFRSGENTPCTYALEGSIAGAGSTLQWLRERLGFFVNASESDDLASSVNDTAGVVFVPAFGGLLAPYWKSDARATIIGMTQQTTKGHIVRAAFEGISMQVEAVVRKVEEDTGIKFTMLRVDGGLANSKVMMQMQADLLDIPVHVPKMLETTALGAALCAGIGIGLYTIEELMNTASSPATVNDTTSSASRTCPIQHIYRSKIGLTERKNRKDLWAKGLERSFGWSKM